MLGSEAKGKRFSGTPEWLLQKGNDLISFPCPEFYRNSEVLKYSGGKIIELSLGNTSRIDLFLQTMDAVFFKNVSLQCII